MADLYSVIPGLQPNSQDILEAELLAKQILEAKYPTLDLREGTGLRDLLIRPLAVFAALTRNGLDYIFTQNRLSDVDDATPPDLVDSILSNWFLTRKIGTKSVISARLYFSRKKNVSISTDIYFSTDSTLKYYPTESTTYSAEGLVFDSFSNEYYVDVDLAAEKEGSTYNIGSGSLLYFSNFDPYFLRAEINYLKEASIESESNTQFISRAKTAISTRNLINEPSIDSNLKEAFNYIKRLVSVGMGDVNMIRDKIKAVFPDLAPRTATSLTSASTLATVTLANHGYNVNQLVSISGANPDSYNGLKAIAFVSDDTFSYYLGTTAGVVTSLPTITTINMPTIIHNGGMVDIYCSDTLATAIVQVTTDETGKAHLTGPIYSVTRSTISGGGSDDTVPANATFTIIPANTDSILIGGVTGGNKQLTITVANHGLAAGEYVTIVNSSRSNFNGSWRITSIIDTDQFTVSFPSDVTGQNTLVNVSGSLNVVIPWYDYGFSQKQDLIVDLGEANANKTASFEIGYFQYLDSIQEYLDSSANRVVCGDYLARGFNFYQLHIEVTAYNGPAPNSALVDTIIRSYLEGLDPGEMFVVSDMVAKLRLNGIINIQNPPLITFKKYNRFLTPVETGTITDVLDPNDSTNVFLLESVVTKAVNIDPNTLVIS
jgi:hypothetical protein